MTAMKPYELIPVDTLFFRDARPMESGAGSGGHGANWPLPTVVHEALRAALLRRMGSAPAAGTPRGHLRHGRRPFIVTEQFRGLRTRGPFPVRSCEGREVFYLPWPRDWVPRGDCGAEGFVRLAPLAARMPGESDLPEWMHAASSDVRPGKTQPPDWIGFGDFVRSLAGERPVEPLPTDPLFRCEHRIGIEIDRGKGSVKEGQFYTAEHIRLGVGVRLWTGASIEGRTDENAGMTDLTALLGDSITLGGESRQCRVATGIAFPEVPQPPAGTRRIKWVLATHAVFHGGWRPNWIAPEDGRVLLKAGDIVRHAGEGRKQWRLRVRSLPDIRARLVSAVVSKPVFFSGWDASMPAEGGGASGGPKPTLLAAPAGSVYFFEAETGVDGDALAHALHGRNQSDFLGEKGLGLGYCGIWDHLADVPRRPVD